MPVHETTPYDRQHAVTCTRPLDADAESADWREVAKIMLRIDPSHEPVRARRAHESHLVRAKCVSRHGHRRLALTPFGTLFATARW
ncbi:hypothetical protein J2R76_003738 [Bradyrhizobium sp. USDA 4532]|nr:hypothetical protein [Bradyrhizobium sp. USDA 4545]MCP1920147.1 hypothetical protein [Bradyrhizobium sp. USDA 4532]